MRSRSDTRASRRTSSWSRARSIAIPAWSAKLSTRRASASVNSSASLLLGQVEVADRGAAHGHRRPKEAVHLGVRRREPVPARIGHHVADEDRPVLA